ncbi:MAG: hypothetical protein HYR55_03995 [Acidobacteria bacterium]|nr:hypothetical protein [Acidobacteriota bacterium]MBI3658036.1 hypothetical protein [Acidobacteriota bacterium]
MPIDPTIRVNLDDLVRALELIVQHIKNYKADPVEIEQDYYWEAAEDQLYDMTQETKKFTIGQLSHDWERIREILDGKNPPIGYAMVWLASILRAVGHIMVP